MNTMVGTPGPSDRSPDRGRLVACMVVPGMGVSDIVGIDLLDIWEGNVYGEMSWKCLWYVW